MAANSNSNNNNTGSSSNNNNNNSAAASNQNNSSSSSASSAGQSPASSTATSATGAITDINHNELPLFLRQLKSYIQDDKVWQSQLFDLLNNYTYNQCEVDLFELMCSVIERSLFAQVDWARNSIFFRDLKVSVDKRRFRGLIVRWLT